MLGRRDTPLDGRGAAGREDGMSYRQTHKKKYNMIVLGCQPLLVLEDIVAANPANHHLSGGGPQLGAHILNIYPKTTKLNHLWVANHRK